MITGSRLELPGKVSSRLLSAVPKIQDIYFRWGAEHWNMEFRRVPVDAEARNGSADRGSGVACFFSGGVDSFYTLLKRRDEVTHLIFVHGFDISLTNEALRTQATNTAREVATELGKPLIEVETNLRSFSDPLIGWGEYFGSAVASVALLFQHLFGKVIIPASHNYADLFPHGSHPLLDPLWSTERTDIEHDGCEATRIDKAAYISRYDLAMKRLRVCWQNPNSAYNCGHCEKCIRTMVNLRAAEALELCKTLPNNLDLKAVEGMYLGDESDEAFARENLQALKRLGTDPALTQAVSKAMVEYRLRRFILEQVRGQLTIILAIIRKRAAKLGREVLSQRVKLGGTFYQSTLKIPGMRKLAQWKGNSPAN
jgi:hypothetical protein